MSGLLSRRKSSTNARELLSASSNTNVRIVLLGKKGVGKSAITVRLLTKRFIGEYDPNLEVTLKYITKVNGEEVVAEVMDTAKNCDEERLNTWTQWADCFVLVYSVVDEESFKDIREIKKSIDRMTTSSLKPTVILANKVDLDTARTVSINAGLEYANEAACPHYELSARENVVTTEKAFSAIIEMTIRCSMLSQINKLCQLPHQRESTGNQKEARERKSSFKSIVKTLTRQKVIKEEIKEVRGEEKGEERGGEKQMTYLKRGGDIMASRPRRRSSTCTF